MNFEKKRQVGDGFSVSLNGVRQDRGRRRIGSDREHFEKKLPLIVGFWYDETAYDKLGLATNWRLGHEI